MTLNEKALEAAFRANHHPLAAAPSKGEAQS